MSVENFLTRMNALVDELRAHPKVTLLNYHVPPPATEEDFAAVEAHIGRPLPNDIKAFYRQCNGIQLRWVHKDNKDVDHKLWSGFMEGPFEHEEILIEQGFEGVVNILDVKSVFFRELPFRLRDLKDMEKQVPLTIEEKQCTIEELVSRIAVFDLLDFNCCFGLVETPNTNKGFAVIQLGQQYRIPKFDAKLLPLSKYLDLIILKKGSAMNRIFDVLPKERKFGSRKLEWMENEESIPNPAPYDLNYPYHR